MTRELQRAREIEHRHQVAKTGNTAHEHTHTNVSSSIHADLPAQAIRDFRGTAAMWTPPPGTGESSLLEEARDPCWTATDLSPQR